MTNKKPNQMKNVETKSENLHIRATPTQKSFLDMMCYENEKSKTDMIFKALEFYHNYRKSSL